MKQKQKEPSTEENKNDLEQYLMQQGFFRDEVNLPHNDSAQMSDLVSCARKFVRDKKLNHGRNPLIYLEAISYCVLHRSYKELEQAQQKALANFAEVVAAEQSEG